MDSVPATPAGPARHQTSSSIDEPPIVDGTLLEAAKENIQPLQRGRRATALSAALSTPHKDRNARLQQERAQMRAELDAAIVEDDDPLEAYLRYIDWTIEAFPQGHNNDSGLISLFDEATRTLKDDDRYKKDLRFLKLWVLYAAQVEKPVDMFSFLFTNEIGTVYGLFYEEYALALERDGLKTEADDIYRVGLARKVHQRDRLQTRYDEFKRRMISGIAEPPPPTQPSLAPASKSRKALGQVKASAPLARSTDSPTTISNARLEVFVDGDDGPVQEPGNEWPEFGTRAGRVKENLREVTRAGDAPYKLSKPPLRIPSAPIAVFRDEDSEDTPQTPSASRSTAFGTPSRGLSEKDNEADLLRRDPFLYYNKAPASPSVSASKASSSAPRPLISLTTNTTPVTKSESEYVDPRYLKLATNPYPHALEPSGGTNGRRAEKHVFDIKLLWANSRETCLAESRAKRLGLLGKQWPAPPPPGEYLVPPKPEPTPKLVRTLNFDEDWPGEPPAFDEPTMTVNTKAALADVYGMFNVTDTFSRIHERREMPPPPPPLPTIPATPILSKENSTMGPPSTIRMKKPMGDSGAFTTPMQPSRPGPTSRTTSTKKGLVLSQRVFTPARDEPVTPRFTPRREEAVQNEPTPAPVTPRASLNIQVADDEDESVFLPPSTAAKTPSFQPYVDDEEEEVIGKPAFKPFVDGDDSFEDDPFIAQQPLAASSFKPFVDDEEDEDELLAAPIPPKPAFEVFADEEAFDNEPQPESQSLGSHSYDCGFAESSTDASESNASGIDRSLLPRIVPLPNASMSFDGSFAVAGDSSRLPFRVSDGHTIAPVLDASAAEASQALESSAAAEPSDDLQITDIPNPCDPYDPDILAMTLSSLEPGPSVHNLRPDRSGHWEVLRRRFAGTSLVRRKTLSNDATAALSSRLTIKLGERDFEVNGKLGEGAFGAVYIARDCSHGSDIHDQLVQSDDLDGLALLAVKIVRPSSRWEHVVLTRVLESLPQELRSSVITPRAFYEYADEGFLIMDLCSQGTLLDVVNRAGELRLQELAAGVDEQLVLFFAIELLRIVTGLHHAGFIHGDLKIDNCMLRLDDDDEPWSQTYDPSGAGGWNMRGIRLIDFGRAIDTRLYPEDQEFVCDWKTDEKDCMEMQAGQSWTFQTDYYGLATIVYTMLFGKHFDGVNVKKDISGNPRYSLKQPFKRYWNPIWPKLFETLLNPTKLRPGGELPIYDELVVLREEMEGVLKTYKKPSSARTASLKSLLRKIEGAW